MLCLAILTHILYGLVMVIKKMAIEVDQYFVLAVSSAC